jgi:hypothetical protein
VPEEAWTPAVLRSASRHASAVEQAVRSVRFSSLLSAGPLHERISRAGDARATLHGLRGERRVKTIDRLLQSSAPLSDGDDRMHLLGEPQALALLRLRLAVSGRIDPSAQGSVWVHDRLGHGGRGLLPRRAQRREVCE